ncbi:hypothetical protein [Flavobacterium sp. LHD-85]|uniref:hypothetical protein n=1 Tax=Flavobacterium sp. LHD-85 TaxID=3071410 RepID=UPI0027E1DD96|nr:hypothetical protein [Flavobacterium sp. LHD-85]MDQ6531057.1 hypothetical protein [Flavobacterium sp. LHD-85]
MNIAFMQNILILIFLSFAVGCQGQETSTPLVVSEVYSSSKKEKLSTAAYEVFRTNKFLNFKDKDVLVEKIDGVVYKKTDLNNFFDSKKDWVKIQKEDTASYVKKEGAKYAYKDNAMIETVVEVGSYNVRKEIETVYSPKCFVLRYEKKYFVGENYNRTESIANEYDNLNRVTKIIKRTEYSNKKDNTEATIAIKYDDGNAIISTENGTIVCELLKDENSIGTISKLSANDTAEYFRYAIAQQQIETAKEYCSEKMVKKIDENLNLYQNVGGIKWLGGTGSFGEKVTINEDWEITFKDQKTEKCHAIFVLVKQKNGWKIDDFEIAKEALK